MDEIAARATADYDRLLRDEKELGQELLASFTERMRRANLTFGGRLLCPFPRPSFVSPPVYHEIRGVCRRIMRAVEKLEAALGPGLWDLVDLLPEERELVSIDAGYARSTPTARLDSFLTASEYRFVELNAETPAGAAYAETLAQVFLELPLVARFQERWRLGCFHSRERLLQTLVGCYREAGGRKEKPSIAVVDYEEVPTRTEHHMYREFFLAHGHEAVVCDPRRLTYAGGVLRHEGTAIDVVYKRLLVNELLDRIFELRPLVQAVKERAAILVNPFKCKPLHKKAIFAVLTDDAREGLFSEDERSAIRAHVPWTRRVVEGRAKRGGATVDLPEHIRKNRDRLVMKPNDEYGGKGVFIGWEMSESEWEAALAAALRASYVVQEKVDLEKKSFPELGAQGLAWRDLVVDVDPYLFDGEVEGFLTRLSSTSLANVTSGGGQVPSFLVEPA
jgi:hypothetical protein